MGPPPRDLVVERAVETNRGSINNPGLVSAKS